MENILADAHFRHMMLDEENSNTLHCVDEEDDIMNITFQAIIDLEGEHSCIRPFFSLPRTGKFLSYPRLFLLII